ncbi:MAG TPA: type II toxin-antitoxin system RelE/ParE family toxin [Candidatus Acidoferrales bacterium]|nr:type II toxin-antitoxin system RelE/ParE family toxin [Candidatus Acidoferrales bacterium]
MPARFEARYSQQFLSDLRKLDPPIQRRILEAIETKLLRDPFQYSKKLMGKSGPGRWRFRVGDYRIRFDIEGRVLLLYRVRHRREIYE